MAHPISFSLVQVLKFTLIGSFPHPHLGEVRVGTNRLQIYDYGRDLYDAMLAAIDTVVLQK
jgi:hypothetical protein